MLNKVFAAKNITRVFGLGTLMAGLVLLATAVVGAEEPVGQRSYATPRQAADALAAAVKADDQTELLAILGPGSEDLVDSGDPVADRKGRARFVRAYEGKNSLEEAAEDRRVLIVGQRDYPFPIPIVRRGELWLFDTPAGSEEILDRRIGRNELHTIRVMQAYVDAQREFVCRKGNVGREFAQKFVSSAGKQDGLYWPAAPGEEESPFGPLIAKATGEGYVNGLDQQAPEPFHGYLYKILRAQGEHAEGGAFDYVVEDKMVLGFALVAYPARYGASGIMTFMVNQEGMIYEKDLGDQTGAEAAAMTVFDPGAGWRQYREDEDK